MQSCRAEITEFTGSLARRTQKLLLSSQSLSPRPLSYYHSYYHHSHCYSLLCAVLSPAHCSLLALSTIHIVSTHTPLRALCTHQFSLPLEFSTSSPAFPIHFPISFPSKLPFKMLSCSSFHSNCTFTRPHRRPHPHRAIDSR